MSSGWFRDVVAGTGTGVAGTAAMTATTWLESRLRDVDDLPVDYDATGHVVTAVSRVLRVEPSTDAQATALFLLAHWGYGSATASTHRVLRRRLSRPRAAVVFFVGCQSMAFVLLPVLGETPPPWRWRRDVLMSSLLQHAVYAGVVSLADRAVPALGRHR